MGADEKEGIETGRLLKPCRRDERHSPFALLSQANKYAEDEGNDAE